MLYSSVSLGTQLMEEMATGEAGKEGGRDYGSHSCAIQGSELTIYVVVPRIFYTQENSLA